MSMARLVSGLTLIGLGFGAYLVGAMSPGALGGFPVWLYGVALQVAGIVLLVRQRPTLTNSAPAIFLTFGTILASAGSGVGWGTIAFAIPAFGTAFALLLSRRINQCTSAS